MQIALYYSGYYYLLTRQTVTAYYNGIYYAVAFLLTNPVLRDKLNCRSQQLLTKLQLGFA